MNRFVILGSANAVPKVGQDNSHLLIQTETRIIMVDCGDNPIAKLNSINISINDVTDIILTHFHADHVGSLPVLIMGMWLEKRKSPICISGLEVTVEKAKRLLELFNWQDWKEMFPVSFHVIPDAGEVDVIKDDSISVTAIPVLHLIPTVGIRVEFANGRTISYSCDTEPCPAVRQLASEVDIHLQEAAGASKGHTSAEQAGELAASAGAKRLILIHYDNRIDSHVLIDEVKNNFKGDILLAEDMMEI